MVHRGCNSSINSESTGNATFSQTLGDLLPTAEREREWIIYILWNPLFLEKKSCVKEHCQGKWRGNKTRDPSSAAMIFNNIFGDDA